MFLLIHLRNYYRICKQQLVTGMKRIRPFKLGRDPTSNPNKSCKEIAIQFQINKTAPASILKDGQRLRREFEILKFLNFNLFNCKTKAKG